MLSQWIAHRLRDFSRTKFKANGHKFEKKKEKRGA